jgi:BirA family biotin operon repressor/biotin-[acetyl-CoA-carboxylase] ligase
MKSKELLKTLFTGKNAVRLDVVVSTNLTASEHILAHQPADGTAILASFQSAGKGQAGAQWESEAGQNLLVSYIFYPAFIEPKDLFVLNKAIGLGVYDFVKSILKKNVSIKWPNDIYYRDKKIAGLLIENSVTFSEVNYSVVGIGINVNQQAFRKYTPEAESLRNATGKEYDLEECFAALSHCLEARYIQLKQSGSKSINTQYRNALYRLGEYFPFRKRSGIFNARILGVMDDGKLVLEDEKGRLETFRFKEIAFVADVQAHTARERIQTLLSNNS